MVKEILQRSFPIILVSSIGLNISSCGSDTSQVSEVQGTIAGRKMSESEVRMVIINAGFPSTVINKMVCTAWYESNWHTASYNTNRNGSVDIGLLQINSIHWKGCGATRTSLISPPTNAACGRKIFQTQGLSAWYAYRNHKARCDAYAGGTLSFWSIHKKMADESFSDEFEDHQPTEYSIEHIDEAEMNNGLDLPAGEF